MKGHIMRKLINKATSRYLLVCTALTALAVGVLVFADSAAATTVEGGATTLSTTILEVATFVLPLAAGIVAVVFGWRMARKFFHI
jgi:hypothetical protein